MRSRATLRLKNILILSALFAVLPAFPAASPFEEVSAKDELYQRVQGLQRWNLLEAQDAAVLNSGEPVTRLQLAFYTEKAKARLEAPQMAPQPTPIPQVQEMPPLVVPDAPSVDAAPVIETVPVAETAPAPAPIRSAAASSEVDALLMKLKAESAYLRTRLDLANKGLDSREKQLKDLEDNMLKVEGVAGKANKQIGVPNFNTNSKFRYEDLTFRSAAPASLAVGNPLPNQRVNTWGEDIYFGTWADFGMGNITTGFGGFMPLGSGGAEAVSIYLGKPKVQFLFGSKVGKVDLQVMEEAYVSDTTLGDFTRGVEAEIPKRYERPYHVKPWNDEKEMKFWDDYIRSLAFVETKSLVGGNVQSSSDRVFDGLLFKLTDIPYAGSKTKLTALMGRLLVKEWFEYGLRVNRPWLKNDRLSTTFAAMWVDNSDGNQTATPDMDLRNYNGMVSVDLAPLFLTFDGAVSRLWTGYCYDPDLMTTVEPPTYIGYAGRATASVYPLNFTLQNITDEYANFQSKVSLTGLNFPNMGWATKYLNGDQDRFGEIAEVTVPQSNRHGWLANFGWNGRREEWMKRSMPKFLDFIVLNTDLSTRTEYRAVKDNSGHYLIEPWLFTTYYYPEYGAGQWGENIWGGFGGSPKPVRQGYINNITDARSVPVTLEDGVTTAFMNPISDPEVVRYRYRQSTERLPMVNPATLEKLSHIKSYHYLALTNKWQVNKLIGYGKPLYLGIHYAKNRVSGKAATDDQEDIANLFTQKLWDVTVMVGRVLPYVNLVGHVSGETWESAWTYPMVDYDIKNYGFGLGYDIPWGGGKFETRYEHVKFRSAFVPANDWDGDQVFGHMKVLF